jgi:hypothetical protein
MAKNARFDYLLESIMNHEDDDTIMELSKDEQAFFANIDLTDVLFI